MTKPSMQIRSIKQGRYVVHAPQVGEVFTARSGVISNDSVIVVRHSQRTVKFLENAPLDIRNINRALLDPREALPELTSAGNSLTE